MTYPARSRSRPPLVIDAETTPVRAPSRDDAIQAPQRGGPFMRFHYSCTEISLRDGRASVRSRSTTLENGTLTSESFEGDADPAAYQRMVADAQRQFLAHTAAIFDSLTAFLPFRRRGD